MNDQSSSPRHWELSRLLLLALAVVVIGVLALFVATLLQRGTAAISKPAAQELTVQQKDAAMQSLSASQSPQPVTASTSAAKLQILQDLNPN